MDVYTIQGVVIQGIGAASRTVAQQLPGFVARFRELEICHPATINVRLDTRLLVLRPDFQVVSEWGGGQEIVDFLRIGLEIPVGRPRGSAWIYVPHKSPHRENPAHHEILSVFLDEVRPGTSCAVRIFNRLERLPYEKFPGCVVV